MKPQNAKYVPVHVWQVFDDIRCVLERAPEKRFQDPFIVDGQRFGQSSFSPNCYMVCRALAKVFPVEVRDGVVTSSKQVDREFGKDHSWLVFPMETPNMIIDPWPIGTVSGPTLVYHDQYAMQYDNCVSLLWYDQNSMMRARINYLATMFRGIASESRLKTLVS